MKIGNKEITMSTDPKHEVRRLGAVVVSAAVVGLLAAGVGNELGKHDHENKQQKVIEFFSSPNVMDHYDDKSKSLIFSDPKTGEDVSIPFNTYFVDNGDTVDTLAAEAVKDNDAYSFDDYENMIYGQNAQAKTETGTATHIEYGQQFALPSEDVPQTD